MMSSGIGQGLISQASLLPSTGFERKFSSCHPYSLGNSPSRKSFVVRKLKFSSSGIRRNDHSSGLKRRAVTVSPRAVLAMEPSSEVSEKYSLEGGINMEVFVRKPALESATQVDIKIDRSSDSFLLHWGAISDKTGNWVFPSRCPDGSKNYKNRAMRTPFVKDGSRSHIRIEINDPVMKALEFLILDESENKWFKDGGKNFHINLPTTGKDATQKPPIPEELVQIQAYLRWERKGKQMYTPEQEKLEYEASRTELMEEMNKGLSVDDIRAKLTKKSDKEESKELSALVMKSRVPNDLVQVQAYIRWEKAGKPSYSPEKQLEEFEVARKELEAEIDKGVSLDVIREKISAGQISPKVEKQLRSNKYFTVQRIQRKKRDLMQLLTKHVAKAPEKDFFVETPTLKAIEVYAKTLQNQDNTSLLNKKLFKVDDKDLLVIVTESNNKTKVHVATDFKEDLTLHWALSVDERYWSAPPQTMLPANSIILGEAAETQFITSVVDSQMKIFEIEVDKNSYKGMPFVLLSNGRWIKNNGSDYFVNFCDRMVEVKKDSSGGKGTAKQLLEKIAELESEAQKSFMHRFNIAADLVDQSQNAGELAYAGIIVWMRFMATRQLIWNKNYNVKPREISRAQDRLTDLLQNVYIRFPQHRELVRMIMSTVGRGGEGDVGQRIRDEILVIQRNNDCKGGMMEEWHQKLHNNTSPDDVVICQALLNYIEGDFDISLYWKTLNENGITKERLLSYDRAIHSEPNFRRDQRDGLLRDLKHYLRTLKAVHSGADLESAIANCMGYKAEGQGFMVGVQINPISGLPSGFQEILQFVMENIEDRDVEPLLEGLLEAREELRPLLFRSDPRLRDLIFLDLSLESAVRTATERAYEYLDKAEPEKIMYFISLVLENLVLSSNDNEELIYCLKGWNQALEMARNKSTDWALFSKSVLDRTRLALTSKAEWYQNILQPSAEYLGSLLGVNQWAVDIFTEEIIRAGSAAVLSTLLNRIDPVLRQTAHLGSWQVISPVEATGYVVVVNELLSVQDQTYDRPTVIVAKRVKGEEEIPAGAVAVVTPDMPDVLSHVSVRARNSKVCFATCFDPNLLSDLQAIEGHFVRLQPSSDDVKFSRVNDDEFAGKQSSAVQNDNIPVIKLMKKQFAGKYAISSDEFTPALVGAKSRNIAYLTGKVPSSIIVPTSVALPFGTFEKALAYDSNKEVAEKIESLTRKLNDDSSVLPEIRRAVLEMVAPPVLVKELESVMKKSKMPWPGDEGEKRWEQAWTAIKRVWASKWNERAYFSTKKVQLNHDYLSMAVLVQEVVNADYAFVIHTTNPSSGDASEIYAEVVKGLGETLVGAYPGRALSFVCKKSDLGSPRVLGYPSKRVALFIKRSVIFRSDSNGEDLEGYAGAGLYDSVPMDETEEVAVDYTADRMVVDDHFRKTVLCEIARAGSAIEDLYGSPQDVEGVVRDGRVYVVQTRPQM